MAKMNIVISGVNLVEGGILSVLEDCVAAAKGLEIADVKFTLLLNKKNLVNDLDERFTVLEYPNIKKSWLKRIYFEYFSCREISKNIKSDLWISLHDMTPHVHAKMQVVYCHNPSPFYKSKLKDFFIDRKLFLFSYFYKYLYQINIKRNRYVIIQQNWLRIAFEKAYKVPTIVAYPSIQLSQANIDRDHGIKNAQIFTFFYPSFPRIFKNFETLFEAVDQLSVKRRDFQLLVTIDSQQNTLGNRLFQRYGHIEQIKFIGKQTRDQVYGIFQSCDALVFPSKLETWGLPLTEAKQFNKAILAADLEYAHENIQDYKMVKFFDPDDPKKLSGYMDDLIDNRLTFDKNDVITPAQPFFENWDGLLRFLINEAKTNI